MHTLDEWVNMSFIIEPVWRQTGYYRYVAGQPGEARLQILRRLFKLDTQYITKWSIGLDIKILLKTVLAVVKRDGSM